MNEKNRYIPEGVKSFASKVAKGTKSIVTELNPLSKKNIAKDAVKVIDRRIEDLELQKASLNIRLAAIEGNLRHMARAGGDQNFASGHREFGLDNNQIWNFKNEIAKLQKQIDEQVRQKAELTSEYGIGAKRQSLPNQGEKQGNLESADGEFAELR